MAKVITVDNLLAHIAVKREECKKRLAWAKSEHERGFEEGYDRCLATSL